MTRPTTFDEYIGQKTAKAQLKIAIEAAKKEDRPLPHTLLVAPRGMGKTTLAQVIANEMGANLITTLGLNIENQDDILSIFQSYEEGEYAIIFIDEIHNLSKKIEEHFYPIMEDNIMYMEQQIIDLDTGSSTKQTVKVHLEDFTLIGATTIGGNLSPPLRDRFGLTIELTEYTVDELEKMTAQYAQKRELWLERGQAKKIAQRARGRARYLINLIERARDLCVSQDKEILEKDDVERTFDLLGIDEMGLTLKDYEILDFLNNQPISQKDGYPKPVGAKVIINSLGIDQEELEGFIEPYLLKLGLILRMPNGRRISEKGIEYIKEQYSNI